MEWGKVIEAVYKIALTLKIVFEFFAAHKNNKGKHFR